MQLINFLLHKRTNWKRYHFINCTLLSLLSMHSYQLSWDLSRDLFFWPHISMQIPGLTYLWTRSPDCDISLDKISRLSNPWNRSPDFFADLQGRSPDWQILGLDPPNHAPLCCKSSDWVSGSKLRNRCPDRVQNSRRTIILDDDKLRA